MRKLTDTQARLVTRLPGDINLVPSQHNSLPFADAAARSLYLGADGGGTPYRRVWLELSEDLPVVPLLAANLPACGGVVITYPGQPPVTDLSVPIYDAHGQVFASAGEPVFQGGVIPCGPTDSVAVAAWVAAKLISASVKPELVAGDVPSRLRFDLAEDVVKRAPCDSGLDPSRFQMGSISLNQFWEFLKRPTPCQYDQLRDAHMAWELSQIPEDAKPTLAIIGAAHEAGIRKHLSAGTGLRARRDRRDGEALPCTEFVPFSPDLMHSLGWMEMPFIAELFGAYLREMTPASAARRRFDYRAALDQLIEEAVSLHGPMSPRSYATFRRMINEILTLKGSWMVESISELADLGEACVSRAFGVALRATARKASPGLDVTVPGKPRVLFLATFNGLLCRLGDGSLCVLPLPAAPDGEGGKKRLDPISGNDTGQPGPGKGKGGGGCGGLPACSENLHRKRVNSYARKLAHQLLHEEENRRNRAWKSVPYQGDLGMGIDIRGTLRDQSRGNPGALRIRKRKRDEEKSAPPCHNQCPVVYVFDPDLAASGASPSGTQSGSFVFTGRRSVTVAAYWYKGQTKRPHPNILLREMSVYANLFTTEAPEYNEQECRKWIEANIPPDLICESSPWYNNDLDSFRDSILSEALAWAVRYSSHHCVVVSESWLVIPGAVQDYAEQRGVKILSVSAGAVGMDHFDRLRFDTQVPGGKNAWDGPEQWTERFTIPVPGDED